MADTIYKSRHSKEVRNGYCPYWIGNVERGGSGVDVVVRNELKKIS